jgi:hypothetical protein
MEGASDPRSAKIPHYDEMLEVRLQYLDLAWPTLDANRWLSSRSIDVGYAVNIAGPIIEMEITTIPGGLFSFCENREGFLAFVMMVFDRDAESVTDFIAWTRDKPRRVFRYFGYADALAIDQLYNPATYFADGGLMLHRSPLDWLIAGCSGTVVLDPVEFRERLFADRQDIPQCRIVGDCVSRARELRKALSPVPSHVSIFVPASQAAA